MKDYVEAFKACIRAFRGDERLQYEGEYYRLNYLPRTWSPPAHAYTDVKVDIAAVGPYMCESREKLPTAFTCIQCIQ